MCPLPPPSPASCYLPPVSSPPPLVPRIPHPKFVPRGVGVGRAVCWVHRAQVSRVGGPVGGVLETGWAAGGGPVSTRTATVTPGWAFSPWSVERLLRASRPCDVRGAPSGAARSVRLEVFWRK